MATFISTITFTPQGLSSIDETTQRANSLKRAAKKFGCKVVGIYWTLGEQDGILIFQAPDDETSASMLLHLVSKGNVQTKTCRAFNADEMDQIIGKAQLQ